MGDYGESFARTDLDFDEAKDLASAVRAWLIETDVIAADESPDSVLGGVGHRPGPAWETVVNPDWMGPGLLGLRTNGVQIVGGAPDVVAWPNGGDLSSRCPTCSSRIDDEVWPVLNAWVTWRGLTPQPAVRCTSCAVDIPVSNCIFGDQLALSLVKVTFWNWGRLSAEFHSEVMRRLGGDTRYVSGKM